MSRHLLSRIPPNVRDVFRFYECMSKAIRGGRNTEINDYLRRSNPATFMEHYWRMNVTNEQSKIYNAADFPPLIGQIVAPIFQDQYSEAVPALMDEDHFNDPFISSRNHSFKHFTDHQARTLLSFASSLSPYRQVPPAKSTVNSFRWYQRLLRTAPIIFFLKQKQTLMSESSLLSRNPLYEKLRVGVADLVAKYSNSEEYIKRTKNYYLTDLASSDLFRLALLSCKNGAQNSTMRCISPNQDKICDEISRLQRPKVIDRKGEEVDQITLETFLHNNPPSAVSHKLAGLSEINDVHALFPYDIAYNDVYLLTIELPVIEDNHEDLLHFIHSQTEFDVFAVRVSSNFPMSKPFESSLKNSNNVAQNINATYEDLLHWAEKQRENGHMRHTGSSILLQTIGEWGLVEVSESADSLWLTKC